MKPVIIAISGPTNAGKTYFTRELSKRAESNGIRCTRISTDEFYNDLSHLTLEERNEVNYDEPDSINHKEFVEKIKELSEGKGAILPVYDFATHNRTGETRKVDPVDLIIVEGIFSLAFDTVLPYYTLTVYVDLEPDLRLVRRVHRDRIERGRSLESILDQYVHTVKPTQELYVRNDQQKADILIMGDRDHSIIHDMILSYIQHSRK